MDNNRDDNRWRGYYEALYQVAIALGQSLEPDVVLRTLVRGVVKELGLRAASIRLLCDGGLLEPVATEGLSPDYLHKGPVELARSLIDREAITRGPVQIDDVSVDPRFEYPQEAKREGIVSALFVPLCARDLPIGVLRAYTGAPHVFSPEEIELLTALANLGALAISNARLYHMCVRDQQLTNEALWSFRLPEEWLRNRA
jgi:signal transduction protein with GAF and PtsI domain